MGKLNSILLLHLFESYICFVFFLVNFKIKKNESLKKWRPKYHKYSFFYLLLKIKNKKIGFCFLQPTLYNTHQFGCVIGKEKSYNIVLLATAKHRKENT